SGRRGRAGGALVCHRGRVVAQPRMEGNRSRWGTLRGSPIPPRHLGARSLGPEAVPFGALRLRLPARGNTHRDASSAQGAGGTGPAAPSCSYLAVTCGGSAG